jgi:transcriptional regulator with PAS, ATPase and Fis domain
VFLEDQIIYNEPPVLRVGEEGGEYTSFVVGRSEAAKELLKRIYKCAQSEADVLILGETGAGKEVVARLIHYLSTRSSKPFVAQNCAAIPQDLLESELFGVRKGAFTSAIHDKKGLFEVTNGGSILLDEITEIPLSTQAKLLRVVETKEIRAVGDVWFHKLDVRIFSTTNRDLYTDTRKGTFREDLYYRLGVLQVTVLPLRDRKEDIPYFIERFLQELQGNGSERQIIIEDTALKKLMAHSWPGNIRELKNCLKAALTYGDHRRITVHDLPTSLTRERPLATVFSHWMENGVRDQIEALQKEKLISALIGANGNKSKAAKMLGLSRAALYYNLKKHNLWAL